VGSAEIKIGENMSTERIGFENLFMEFKRVLLKKDFDELRAEQCARLFAETDRDGIYSHGINRFPRFISQIDAGQVLVRAEPSMVFSHGSIERWDGNLGPGNLNALAAAERVIELAETHGMGCVALRNTNHWMRGGSYGWKMAEKGKIGICWTNTMPNMPPWGAKECFVGNNPLILSVPRAEGNIVLDMAMSLYSYGKMENYVLQGKRLPMPGGFDLDGNLTDDPAAILEAKHPVAIGYWKGTGLSLMLDLIGMILSGGDSSMRIGERGSEYGLTQIFLAFDPSIFPDSEKIRMEVLSVIDALHALTPSEKGGKAFYPGERTLQTRIESMEQGIPVDSNVWQRVRGM